MFWHLSDPIQRLRGALADRYSIERQVGMGGMATVYLARDSKHDRQVALKVLRPELAAVLGTERFLSEIRVMAHLQHPHILPLHDSGQAAGLIYYVMPYVAGESLRDRLSREKQLAIEDALEITRVVASASTTRTGTTWCTATSSPKTSYCPTGRPWSRTSGSRSP